MTISAYHFTGETLRDGSLIPPIGEWLRFAGEVVMCESGLHASRHPFDAMQYAPGAMLHWVECEDIVEEQDDKLVCRARKIVRGVDATDMLRAFARRCALDVIHLWNAPAVVCEYLETGDESKRDAAWDAARAARVAAWDAAWNARAAAMNAARGAAGDAARGAAGDAARGAAGDAAWDAARGAQRTRFADMVSAL